MLVDFNSIQTVAGAPRICQQCGKFFIQYRHGSAAKRCPTCADMQQLRPSVVQKRELIAEYDGVHISSLPAEWTSKPAKSAHDDDYFEIDVRGRDIAKADYTGEWQGRICLYADYPHQPETDDDDGAVVKIRHMRVRELVSARYYEHSTRDGRVVTRRKTMPYSGATPGEVYPAAFGKDADSVPVGACRHEWQEREYLFMARTQSPAIRELRYVISGDVATAKEIVDFEMSVTAADRRHTLAIVRLQPEQAATEDEPVFLGTATLESLKATIEEFEEEEFEEI